MKKFRIALAQTKPVLFDKTRNVSIAAEWMHMAAKEKAQIIIFPELFLTGYSIGSRFSEMAETIHGENITRLAALAKSYQMALIMGFAERDERSGQVFDAALYCGADGKIIGTYRKMHLYAAEKEWFARGEEARVWETDYGRVGALICYDVEFPEHARILALRGAGWLAACTGNMLPNEHAQEIFVQARALENRVWVALANRLGAEGEIEFFGGSAICDPRGKIVAQAGREETLLVADIDLDRNTQAIAEDTDYLAERCPQYYAELIKKYENRNNPVEKP